MCGNRSDADDLVQEALLRVGLRWKRVTSRGDPLPYVRGVIARLHISTWRRARRLLVRSSVAEGLEPARSSFELVDDAHVLANALTALGARQRAIVVLTVGYEMPAAEVAEMLGCRESTVRSQRSRGLARLRKAIGDDAEPTTPSTQPTKEVT